VWRVDGWSIISTEKLVPGDRIKLRVGTGDEAIIPCDCLLVCALLF
jgi:magnesium-transporting ATPase (P-type)